MRHASLAAVGAIAFGAASVAAAEPSDFDSPLARAVYCERLSEAVEDEEAAADWFLARDMWAREESGSDMSVTLARVASLPDDDDELDRQHAVCGRELASLQGAIEAHFRRTYGEDFGAADSEFLHEDYGEEYEDDWGDAPMEIDAGPPAAAGDY